MSVFFNGQLLISPAVASVIDDSAMANRNLTTGNVLALVGTSTGGKPNTALRFGSPQEAIAALRSGPLMDACKKAFAPSAQTNSPSTVVAVRVNPATQASLDLDASATAMINLVSTDYGLHANQISVTIESGTNAGKRLTTRTANDYYTEDDVAKDAFSVVYTGGQATATITIADQAVTLSAPAGAPVATIDLNTYATVGQLVDRINSLAGDGWLATVLDGSLDDPALSGLDFVTAQSVKTTAFTVTANLQAIIDWINSAGEGFVTATRAAGAGTVPDNLATTYLAGGSDGTTTSSEWADAFSTLQSEDVQWVVPLTADASIHAQADAHCVYMSSVGRLERRCFVGGAIGQTVAEVKAAAKLLNSDRCAQVYPGYYDYNAAGDLTLYASYMSAAMVAAGFAGLNPGNAMTNKSVKSRGLETKLRNPTDTDVLIKAGVLCLETTTTGDKVVQSVSSWLNNSNYNRVEVSVGYACDYMSREVRDAVAPMLGGPGNPRSLALIAEYAKGRLQELSRPEPAGPGILVGDAENPPFRDIQVSLEGDVVRLEFQASPVIPMNYILATIHVVPYTGSVSV